MLPLSHIRAVTVRLREIPGGVLVGEAIRRLFRNQARIVEIVDFDGNMRMSLDLNEHMQSQIFWHGSYSRNILFLLRKILAPGMVVIDVGANIGEISLVAAKRVGDVGRVVAFEPVNALADQLESHAAANRLRNLDVVRMGLSDHIGQAPIYSTAEAFHDGTQNRGLGSLYPANGRALAASTVPLTTLDDYARKNLQRIDLVKLDIEGGELAALNGSMSVLERYRPALIVEIAASNCKAAGHEMADVMALLSGLGYATFRIGRRGALSPISTEDLGPFQNVYCVHR